MSDLALPGSIQPALRKGPDLDKGFHPLTGVIYLGVVAAALLFVAYSIYSILTPRARGSRPTCPIILLLVALLIALGFEFVNGFHDTANAVATVIYTRSLPANFAVVWSGLCNLPAFCCPSGAVAFGIVSLLPVELILQVGSQRRLRHGLRAPDRRDHLESRHLVVRPAGVLLAHPDRLDHRRRHRQRADARPRRHLGRRLEQAAEYRQGIAPVAGVRLRACRRCCFILKTPLRRATPALFAEPGGRPAAAAMDPEHPGPDLHAGQLLPRLERRPEGHGPIMLILIGTVQTAYALNRAMPSSQIEAFSKNSDAARKDIASKAGGHQILGNPRPAVTNYVAQHQINEGTYPSLAALVTDISKQVNEYGSLASVEQDATETEATAT